MYNYLNNRGEIDCQSSHHTNAHHYSTILQSVTVLILLTGSSEGHIALHHVKDTPTYEIKSKFNFLRRDHEQPRRHSPEALGTSSSPSPFLADFSYNRM